MRTSPTKEWVQQEEKPGYFSLYAESVEVAKIYPSRKENAEIWGYTLSTRNYGEGFKSDPRNYNLTLGAAMDRGEHHLNRYQEQSLEASRKEQTENRYQSGQETNGAQESQEKEETQSALKDQNQEAGSEHQDMAHQEPEL